LGVRVCYVVESGTDVRTVDGLAERCELTLLVRQIAGGVAVSRAPARAVPTTEGPPSRARFAALVARFLWRASRSFDHALVQGYGPAACAAVLAQRWGGPPVTLLVGSPVERYYRCRRSNPTPGRPWHPLGPLGLSVLARVNARLASRYVVLSEHLADEVRARRPRAPVLVIPVYGVDLTRFVPAAEPRPTLRRRLRLPEEAALVFHSSRVAPEKDTHTVLQALHRLRAAGRDVVLLHRSGGWQAVAEMAARIGVGDAVIATDAVHPLDQLPASYQAADLVVQASHEEGLGFSVLEALACGTPVVASAVGGLRETVRDGETGWSVPPRDPQAMACAIADVLDHPDEARRRAEAGRAMVADRYQAGPTFESLFAALGQR
jgi:glycosyltransferase involved in cell wall biosynthesis